MEKKYNVGLKKCERIHKEKLIQQLFNGTNKSFSAYPIRIVFMLTDRSLVDAPVSMMVSVSKRRFKHAVDRNRLKRLIRESYRLNKQCVWRALEQYNEAQRPAEETSKSGDKALLIAFLWLSDKHLPYAQVEERIKKLLLRVSDKLYLANTTSSQPHGANENPSDTL
jgi:ribonuclease P protein component